MDIPNTLFGNGPAPGTAAGTAPTTATTAEAAGRDVTSKHVAYIDASIDWLRIDHVLAGTRAVKRHASQYVPKTRDHHKYPDTFTDMIDRASFVNWTDHTLGEMEGLIFRKDMQVVVPERYKPRINDLNNAGDQASVVAKKIVRGVISHGRVGILVDCMDKDDQRDDDKASLLPFLRVYSAWNITNWRHRMIRGRLEVDQVILSELYDEPRDYGSVPKIRFRELALDAAGYCYVRMHYPNASGEYIAGEPQYPKTPSNKGNPYLTKIPFVFINPIDLSAEVHKSPLIDLVEANLHHFLLSAYRNNALFLSSEPTPVISGLPEGMPIDFQLGSGRVLTLPEGASASMLEFHGQGIGPLETAMKDDKDHIEGLGARLQSTANAPETASAVRIRQHTQTSVISSIARTVSDGIKSAIEHACRWMEIDGKVEVELNQDYIESTIDPRLLAELRTTHDMGYLSDEDYAYQLHKWEVVRPGTTLEETIAELRRLREEAPPKLMSIVGKSPRPAVVPAHPTADVGQPVVRKNGGVEVKIKPGTAR
jgi:uncharacterized protein DUF4055